MSSIQKWLVFSTAGKNTYRNHQNETLYINKENRRYFHVNNKIRFKGTVVNQALYHLYFPLSMTMSAVNGLIKIE